MGGSHRPGWDRALSRRSLIKMVPAAGPGLGAASVLTAGSQAPATAPAPTTAPQATAAASVPAKPTTAYMYVPLYADRYAYYAKPWVKNMKAN